MSSKTLLTPTRRPLAMLAVLLLLCGLAVPRTALAQGESHTFPCMGGSSPGLNLPAELAELDLTGLQAALQEQVDANIEATVTLFFTGREHSTIRADLLLADEAVLVALLEGEPHNVTLAFSEGGELPDVVALEVSTAEDCSGSGYCVYDFELPAALADLDVPELRAALEGMLSGDAEATVAVGIDGEPAIVRADELSGLPDPVLEGLLVGGSLSVTLVFEGDGTVEIVDIALPGPECEDTGGPPEPGPKPGTIPDNQQGGGDTVTKTFELTLNGTVPEGETFVVRIGVVSGGEGNMDELSLCGKGAQDECASDGASYGGSIEVPVGARIDFSFVRSSTSEVFHEGTETIHADMTNTAWYTFGKDAGGGDDQMDDTQDDGTGAGDAPHDDQQVEVPEELPETGAGGLAPGGLVPAGNAAAGLALILGAGYAAFRLH